MALRKDIKKVLVIGSGPIIIGQAAEFDYAGTQACRALKEEGLEVVLINSNPATIMTDKNMADKIYIEPLTLDVVKKIIRLEKPDSLLSTLGGQTGLTLSMQLAKEGFLKANNVKLLGARPEVIDRAEDRQIFKDTMEKIGEPCIPSLVVQSVDDALDFAKTTLYPVIVRPAYTLGGTGGGIAHDEVTLRQIAENGLRSSPINQILVEKCVSGYKEIEFEVIRDSKGNAIIVCSMENLDPVGVHTGDSIVVAPVVTLGNKEFNMLRNSALNIVNALEVEGGCNVQFALDPESFVYGVIEVNPRVSRSSALASKATGYPIARVATKIAVGYMLDEIVNQVTGTTYANDEPVIDYLALKFPRFAFDKFVYAKKTLGTQMKATGEVMAIGTGFESALMKAVRGAEIGMDSLNKPEFSELSDEEVIKRLSNIDVDRIFCVFEALKRGVGEYLINKITRIDRWFIRKIKSLVDIERELSNSDITTELYNRAKKYGYSDKTIRQISGGDISQNEKRAVAYKSVDTCAAQHESRTPYFYGTFDQNDEAVKFIERNNNGRKRIIVFGSGPIRIGQGIEFDYCSVHCVWALREMGYEAVICNNNPETVSTDIDTGDRLYFEPLTPEDVDGILSVEKPDGVVVQFGGQTAIKLTDYLSKKGVNILGTSAKSIDAAEDREKFDALLENCNIPRPNGYTVMTTDEAIKAADELGYPVLLRPSYVLGGQNMIIAHGEQDVTEYMNIITATKLENPVLIDKYICGVEVEVDAICDGTDFFIPGIMEHLERAGVHSGDSISVYPTQTLSKKIKQIIVNYTEKLAKALKVVGLVNIQYVVYNDEVYVIEVNPRSSRTVPYISKVTGVPMVDIATRAMLGISLKEQGYTTGIHPEGDYIAVKVPVFSFEKLHDVDTQLGPEMKSTGEVLGIAKTFDEALFKGLMAAGMKMFTEGGVLFTVRNSDKPEVVRIAERFERLGFKLYATSGTCSKLNREWVAASFVYKISDVLHFDDTSSEKEKPEKEKRKEPNVLSLLESGKIQYVISTSETGRKPALDSVQIRRKSVERGIACFTSLDTASALLTCLEMKKSINDIEMVDITEL
ncbi:MAG: carbamoyl-phosphate synthase large subunit [Oscillospiraceae bacterium]|nr:carbamoyl-phosphate synthase large subunit [Oscillospiraceae bacterium]